ncbi:hypothetical protein BAMTA208_03660 [Bacillus amyloliquefaciens TA208]|nr:hypothetical protein BAMTA208_03660 [Bacillus amyloliquefaciens TA208]
MTGLMLEETPMLRKIRNSPTAGSVRLNEAAHQINAAKYSTTPGMTEIWAPSSDQEEKPSHSKM